MPAYRERTNMRFSTTAACLLLLAGLMSGCASLRQDRFQVNLSALDYLQIVQTEQASTNAPPVTTRIDLSGSGYLEMKTGRSERVRSGFWTDPASPAWQDIRTHQRVLPAAETQAFFQAFVHAGVFDKQTRRRKNDPEPSLAILIAVGRKKTLLLTGEPVYLQLFQALQQAVR